MTKPLDPQTFQQQQVSPVPTKLQPNSFLLNSSNLSATSMHKRGHPFTKAAASKLEAKQSKQDLWMSLNSTQLLHSHQLSHKQLLMGDDLKSEQELSVRKEPGARALGKAFLSKPSKSKPRAIPHKKSLAMHQQKKDSTKIFRT